MFDYFQKRPTPVPCPTLSFKEQVEAAKRTHEMYEDMAPGAGPVRAMAFDAGKPDLSLVPADWSLAIVAPFQAGIDKGYARDNWKQSLNTEDHDAFVRKRLNSLERHTLALKDGEMYDAETGVHHGILAAWNGQVISWYDRSDERKMGIGAW